MEKAAPIVSECKRYQDYDLLEVSPGAKETGIEAKRLYDHIVFLHNHVVENQDEAKSFALRNLNPGTFQELITKDEAFFKLADPVFNK